MEGQGITDVFYKCSSIHISVRQIGWKNNRQRKTKRSHGSSGFPTSGTMYPVSFSPWYLFCWMLPSLWSMHIGTEIPMVLWSLLVDAEWLWILTARLLSSLCFEELSLLWGIRWSADFYLSTTAYSYISLQDASYSSGLCFTPWCIWQT